MKAYDNLLPFINNGKIVIFEGGGMDRDLISWMKKYNRRPITSIIDKCSFEVICNDFPFISQFVNK